MVDVAIYIRLDQYLLWIRIRKNRHFFSNIPQIKGKDVCLSRCLFLQIESDNLVKYNYCIRQSVDDRLRETISQESAKEVLNLEFIGALVRYFFEKGG